MRSLLYIVISACLFWVPVSVVSPLSQAVESYAAAPHGWERVGTTDAVDVYRRELTSSPVVAFRGQGYIDSPIERVASVILDEKRLTEWVDSLEEGKLLKMYGEREFLQYSHIGTPFVIQDRDFLIRGKILADQGEDSFTIILRSVEDPLMPPTKYVRGDLKGYWKLYSVEGGKKTYLIAEMHADPKGDVPKWLVNLIQKQWPTNTFKSLRKQVNKEGVTTLPQIAAHFAAEKPITTSAAKSVVAPMSSAK